MKCKVCAGALELYLENLHDDRYGSPGNFCVYRCTKCGFGQTHPQLTKKQIPDLYAKYYPTGPIRARGIPGRFTRWLKGLGAAAYYNVEGAGKRILDVGCGNGASVLELVQSGHEAEGIEPDYKYVKRAKSMGIPIRQGFIYDVEGRNIYDEVLASQVLEHEMDPVKFLQKAKNLIKPDGEIILTMPNTDSVYKRVWNKKWIHWHVPYHLNHFSRESVEILAKKTGLVIKKMTTTTPNLWTVLQIRTILAKDSKSVWQVSKGGAASSNFVSKLLTLILLSIEYGFFFNRLFDFLGWGESFVVTLKKNA